MCIRDSLCQVVAAGEGCQLVGEGLDTNRNGELCLNSFLQFQDGARKTAQCESLVIQRLSSSAVQLKVEHCTFIHVMVTVSQHIALMHRRTSSTHRLSIPKSRSGPERASEFVVSRS